MSEDVGPFAGTARYYSEFRPAYPTAVFELLAIEAPLTPTSRTLDLGCGTGLVSLPLAERVASVTGVDVDQAMLDEAARLADEQGQTNLRWVLSRAERFDDDPGSYELVVIGSAFTGWIAPSWPPKPTNYWCRVACSLYWAIRHR